MERKASRWHREGRPQLCISLSNGDSAALLLTLKVTVRGKDTNVECLTNGITCTKRVFFLKLLTHLLARI